MIESYAPKGQNSLFFVINSIQLLFEYRKPILLYKEEPGAEVRKTATDMKWGVRSDQGRKSWVAGTIIFNCVGLARGPLLTVYFTNLTVSCLCFWCFGPWTRYQDLCSPRWKCIPDSLKRRCCCVCCVIFNIEGRSCSHSDDNTRTGREEFCSV